MKSNRIFLRSWLESDAESLYKYAGDPDVGPRAGWPPHQSVGESLEVIRTVFHSDTIWAIVLIETNEAIGCIGYGPCDLDMPSREGEPLVGYWVAKPYWNQGICTEALQMVIAHIKANTDIHSLISSHYFDNPASGQVMLKCGFVPTGDVRPDGTPYSVDGKPVRILRLTLN